MVQIAHSTDAIVLLATVQEIALPANCRWHLGAGTFDPRSLRSVTNSDHVLPFCLPNIQEIWLRDTEAATVHRLPQLGSAANAMAVLLALVRFLIV